MNETKKKRLEITIISVCLLILLARFLFPAGSAKKQQAPADLREAGTSNLGEAKKVFSDMKDAIKNKKESVEAHFRDIFQKPANVLEYQNNALAGSSKKDYGEPGEKKLVLEGVVWGGSRNTAIISGSVVFEGDTIQNAKVLKIGPEGVILLQNGSKIELKR
jgi:hypothetical protein